MFLLLAGVAAAGVAQMAAEALGEACRPGLPVGQEPADLVVGEDPLAVGVAAPVVAVHHVRGALAGPRGPTPRQSGVGEVATRAPASSPLGSQSDGSGSRWWAGVAGVFEGRKPFAAQ